MNVLVSCAGLIPVTTTSSKLLIQFKTSKVFRFADCNKLQLNPSNINGVCIQTSVTQSTRFKCSASLGSNQQRSTFNTSNLEPFWVTLFKDVVWGLRSLIEFLVQQPGQLKHIEWPSFQSTLKTAALTLVLVAMLIVAVSTVDSGLCYLLALLLRKSA